MSDKRAFFKVDVGYFMNPKVHAIRNAARNASSNAECNAERNARASDGGNAVLAHLASIAYCAQHLTDGHVPESLILMIVGGSPSDGDALEEVGLWHRPGHDCPDCPPVSAGEAYVHDYLRHNRDSDEVKSKSDRARRAARVRWDAERNAPSNATSNANRNAERNATSNAEREEREEREKPLTSEIASDPEREDVTALLDLLDREIEANGNRPPKRSKANRDAMRLLLDRDHRTPEQVAYVIRWCQADDFWQANILSASKLREKFDQLVAKIRSNHQRANRPSEKEQRNQDILNAFVAEEDHPYIEGIPA